MKPGAILWHAADNTRDFTAPAVARQLQLLRERVLADCALLARELRAHLSTPAGARFQVQRQLFK